MLNLHRSSSEPNDQDLFSSKTSLNQLYCAIIEKKDNEQIEISNLIQPRAVLLWNTDISDGSILLTYLLKNSFQLALPPPTTPLLLITGTITSVN